MAGASSMETSGGVARKTSATAPPRTASGVQARRAGPLPPRIAGSRTGIFAVLQQNQLHTPMALQNPDQLRAAVTPIPDNANPDAHLD